jgi:hypothetical protein
LCEKAPISPGILAAIIVPIILALAIIGAVIFIVLYRRRKNAKQQQKDQPQKSSDVDSKQPEPNQDTVSTKDIELSAMPSFYLKNITIASSIGKGAFGEVFAGQYKDIQVALKCISSSGKDTSLENDISVLK